ncbi:MAG: cytochrome P450 [Candidatus Binatia bacterium]|nr:cytochrome P450 [Candidatus Binatia bacterium]
MDYNPLAPEVMANPYPYYAELRNKAPVAWLEPLQCWAVSRYVDVDFALRNPQLFPSSVFTAQALGDLNPVPETPWILDMNPPDHTRLRKLVNKAFTPRLIRALEPRVREITQELVAALTRHPETDLVASFSGPLPTIVIAEMLGVERARLHDFKRWSDDIVLATSRPRDEAVRARVRASGAEFRAYMEEMIARRRREPAEDLITALVRAEEERDMLSATEILALVVLLLLAGNETTTNLIGNAVCSLLDHPAELAKVRADPALVPSMIEEVLRYESPVQVIFRQTACEVELEGGTIPAGATVFLLLGSANRDERKFPEPDRFDVTRNPQDHLAFGYGIHLCLGAPLARLEGRVALEALLFDCPPFACTRPYLPRIASLIVRGVQTLPLRFTTPAVAAAMQ